jgi:hypothetical protein
MKRRWTIRGVQLGAVLSLALSCLLCAAGAAPAESSGAASPPPPFLVVAHASLGVNAVEVSELRDLFLRRTEALQGQQCVPLNYPSGAELRVLFDDKVLRMTPDQVGRYWVDLRIRGGGRPPRTVPTAEIMLRVVGALRGAVGYVPGDAAIPAGVKILAVRSLHLRARPR